MSTSLPYFPSREILPTFSNHQCTSSHTYAETDSSSNFCIHMAFKSAALQQRNIVMASQLDPDVYGVQVYDIDLHHLPKIGWLDVDRQFYVKISIDDGTTYRLTSQEKPSSMPWTGKHAFDVRDSTTLTLEVFAHRKHHHDQYIGMVQGRVEQFLGYPGAVIEQLTGSKGERLRASLEFKITSILGLERPAQGPDDAKNGDYANGLGSSHGHLDAVPPAVQIFDIDLHHLPRIGLVSAENRQFYVHAFVDERNHKSDSTTAEKLHSLPWTTKLQLNVRASSTISLKVFAQRLVHEDEYIGMVQERVETLLAHPGTKIYRLIPSEGHGDKIAPRASMEFKVMPLNHAIEHSVSQLTESQLAGETDGIPPMPGAGGEGLIDGLNEHIQHTAGIVAVASVFPPLLKKIDIFVQIAGKFAEAHPYIKMAFTVLTAAYNVVHSQFVRDQCVHRLLSVINETYGLITSVEGLKKIESQAKTITSLAYQTVECSYFIREYMKSKRGWKNCISNAWSNIDSKIQGYEAKFKELNNALHHQTAIQTQLYVVHLHDLILDHAARVGLKDMHYAVGASYKSQKSHEVGIVPSMIDVVESIVSWVNQDTGPQVFLLLGTQESEKFTIAHTIACQFDPIRRLGSSYFFSCAAQDKRNATNLFSTIAFDLAHHDPQYMKALWDIVKDDRTLRETDDPLTQFTSLILAPAKQMTFHGPVLVVIDGLEYSGSKSAVEGLLKVLAEKGAELPLNFKFLITCQPDEDVHTVFRGKSHVVQEHLSCRITPRTSTSTLNSSDSSALFSAQDNAGYSFSESSPSSISTHEEPRPLKSVVEVLQMVSTTVEVSERGRHIRRIQSQNFKSWTVEQHDHQQRSLSLDPVVSAGDLPLTVGSTYSLSDLPPPYAR